MKLVIGNKNYSSWSMRPLAAHDGARHAVRGKERLSFADPQWKQARARVCADGGWVPILVDGELTVWDTLAIVEYLAEKIPGPWRLAAGRPGVRAAVRARDRRRDARWFSRRCATPCT